MQVSSTKIHSPMAGKQPEPKPGAVVERSVNKGEDGTTTVSKSLALPNGKTMTSERVVTRNADGFSMHIDKLLPNGRHLVIDVTKTNAVEEPEPTPADETPPADDVGQTAEGDATSGSPETPPAT